MEGVEERENEGEGVGEAQGEASWMQGKSQMLDEVYFILLYNNVCNTMYILVTCCHYNYYSG